MKKHTLILFTVLLFVAGCAGMGNFLALPVIETSRTYHASYDQVWHATVAALGEQGMHVTTLDKESGFIQTGYKNTDQTHMLQYAGAGGLRYSTFRYMLSVSVIPQDDGNVTASVSLAAEGYTADKTEDFNARKNMYWRSLTSFKYMERDVIKAISAKLPASAIIQTPAAQ